jgi:hypothetical protein
VNLPQPPPGALVLVRPAQAERYAMRRLTTLMIVLIILLAVVFAVIAGDVAIATALDVGSLALLISVAFLLCTGVRPTISLVKVVRWRRAEAAFRGTALWVSPDGVAYAGPSGFFPAPWSAVRGIRFEGRPGGRGGRAEALRVDVDGWGGPLAANGEPVALRLPLAGLGVDRDTIARAVYELSRDRVAVAA